MAVPETLHKQCLQTVAFAMRQQKGRDIDSAEIRPAMGDLGSIDSLFSWSSNISSFYRIADNMTRDFVTWRDMGNRGKLDEWVDSAKWTANAIVGSNHIGGSGYVYVEEDSVPQFKTTFQALARDIKENARDPLVKTVYGRVAAGTGDKWNPADVVAFKSSKYNHLERAMTMYATGRVNDKRVRDFGK